MRKYFENLSCCRKAVWGTTLILKSEKVKSNLTSEFTLSIRTYTSMNLCLFHKKRYPNCALEYFTCLYIINGTKYYIVLSRKIQYKMK